MHDSGDYLLTPEVCMEHTVDAMIVCVFCMLMGPRPACFYFCSYWADEGHCYIFVSCCGSDSFGSRKATYMKCEQR